MPIKLAYLCSSHSWGGLEMNQFKNARWMEARGHKVLFFCRPETPLAKKAAEHGCAVWEILEHERYNYTKAAKHFAKQMDNLGVTHLIVRDPRDLRIAVGAKRRMKRKVHLSYFMEMQLGVSKRNFFHTWRFSFIDCWCCPSHWLEKQVLRLTKFDRRKLKVLPSGLHLSEFSCKTSKEEARQTLGLPQEGFVFGLIGRFDEHKGQLLLLEAIDHIKDVDVKVCLVGESTLGEDKTYEARMQAFIEQKKLKDRVFIRPFQDDVALVYHSLDATVLASKAESFGMVTIESLACGVPVLASNSGSSPELLDYGKFGLLFEPMDAESLARKMRLLMEKPLLFPAELLQAEAEKYDHQHVCLAVEKLLGLV